MTHLILKKFGPHTENHFDESHKIFLRPSHWFSEIVPFVGPLPPRNGTRGLV